MVKEEIVGISIYRWHEITNYMISHDSRTNRHFFSPLGFFARMDKKKMNSEFVKKMFTTGVLPELLMRTIAWKRQAFYSIVFANCLIFIILSLLRDNIVLLEAIKQMSRSPDTATYSNSSSNSTEFCDNNGLLKYTTSVTHLMEVLILLGCAVMGSLTLISIVRGYIRYKKHGYMFTDLSNKKRSLADSSILFVRYFLHTGFYLTVIVEVFFTRYLTLHPSEWALEFLNAIRLMADLYGLWTIRSYLRYFPFVGHIILYMEKIFVHFNLLLIVLLYITFFFTRIQMLFFNLNSNQGCVEEFSNPLVSYYTMFQTFLNMKDYTGYNSNSKTTLYANHMTYVFIVGLLIFNILVAMITDSVDTVSENRDIEITLSQLESIREIEYNMAAIPLCGRWYCRYWAYFAKFYFPNADGRFYAVEVVSGNRKNQENVIFTNTTTFGHKYRSFSYRPARI